VGDRADIRLAGHYRRLAKDYEYLPVTSENTVYLAMTLTLARRLARAATLIFSDTL
jgi:hypothetical protein